MAKKLFIFCATLAFCVLLTNASIYRTVVEFEEDDVATNPGRGGSSQQKCQKEFQKEKHLQSCQKWIRMQMKKGRPGVSLELDSNFGNQYPGLMLFQECCEELQQVDQEDPVCVCPTLGRAVSSVLSEGRGYHEPSQVSQLFQKAKIVPKKCGIWQAGDVGVCPFRAPRSSSY